MKIFGKRPEHLVIETLSECLSGRLPPGEARHVENHVEICTGCGKELDSLRNTVSLMRRVPMVAPRTAFTLSETPVEVSSQERVSWLPGWSYGAAASVALMVFALVLSADVAGLLADDVAAPAPASGTSAEDTGAFVPEALTAAPVPEGATETSAREPTAVTEIVVESEAVEAPAAPQAAEAWEAQPVADLAEEGAVPPRIAQAAVSQLLEKATEPEAAAEPALAAPTLAITEALVGESAAVPLAEEILLSAASDGSEKTDGTKLAAVAATEGGAPTTGPSGSAEPDASTVAPVGEVSQGHQPTPSVATREATSILWRVLEGFAGGLAVAIIAVFLWMNRGQKRLST